MEYLKTWQSRFKTCVEVWDEKYKEATAKKLTPEKEAQLDVLLTRRKSLNQEYDSLKKDGTKLREANLLFRDQLFPLEEEIYEFWKENGYSELLVVEDGRVGLKSLDGGMALPAIYEDICLTYDDRDFFWQWLFVVKQNGKWGIVNEQQEVLLPFEYDRIIRRVGWDTYILVKDGKQGIADIEHPGRIVIAVSVEMDAIYDVPEWDLYLFTKNGKWGWWFSGDEKYYETFCQPEFDEIFVQPKEEVLQMEDDEDEIFAVRKGNKYYDILYWTIK